MFFQLETGRGRRQVFCDKKCTKLFHSLAETARRSAAHKASRSKLKCEVCSASLADRMHGRFCSMRCSEVSRGTRLAEPIPDRVCAMAECSVVFAPYSDKQRCCCEAHGKKHCNRVGRAEGRYKSTPWNESAKNRDQKRRAIKAGAATGVPVKFSEIAERDKWKCSLCGGRVLKSKSSPHPRSASLDHVIPLSLGGAHDPSNVSLAHLLCNTTKSNRGGGEQLALIG